MSGSPTFLAPGQRYIGSFASPWQIELQLTILAIEENSPGPTYVVFRGPNGSCTTIAAELEYAITEGQIIPVTSDFTLFAS